MLSTRIEKPRTPVLNLAGQGMKAGAHYRNQTLNTFFFPSPGGRHYLLHLLREDWRMTVQPGSPPSLPIQTVP